MRMVEEDGKLKLCELIVDQEVVHTFSDVDSYTQKMSWNELSKRNTDVLNFIFSDKVSVPLQFAVSGVRKYDYHFIL